MKKNILSSKQKIFRNLKSCFEFEKTKATIKNKVTQLF